MADAKITELTELTSVESTDLIAVVDDPSGSPITKKATVSNLTASKAPIASPTFTGTVILPAVEIQDTSADHQYVLAVSELTADRTVTLPLLTGNDEFVFKDHTQTLTNKTLTSPVINGEVTGTFGGYNNSLSRQAIINGNFDVWQRGTSITLANITLSSIADRWQNYLERDGGTLPTLTQSQQSLTPGDIDSAFYYLRLTTNGAGTSLGANSYHRCFQTIENGTRYLCGNGKKVTVSFWAKSDIANKRLGISLGQNYGTGGSPTSEEQIITKEPITLTSTWTKYTITFTTNTLSGKTFGTGKDDLLRLNFWYAWGNTTGNIAVYPSVSAETYVGAGYIDIAQVQLCAGDVALPFMPKSFEEELRACQRYFYKIGSDSAATYYATGMCNATTVGVFVINFPVEMRIAPTSVETTGTATHYKIVTSGDTNNVLNAVPDLITAALATKNLMLVRATVASGLTAGQACLLGNNSTNAYLAFSAEL